MFNISNNKKKIILKITHRSHHEANILSHLICWISHHHNVVAVCFRSFPHIIFSNIIIYNANRAEQWKEWEMLRQMNNRDTLYYIRMHNVLCLCLDREPIIQILLYTILDKLHDGWVFTLHFWFILFLRKYIYPLK